ncbi:MAG: TlyA family RNA methyltransferase [Nitrospirae bacterium]|nr:TlyA family RNA methyltransferase [Nitrospirota bacterium]
MSPSKKIRLDKLLLDKGLVESREKARALILEGNVTVNGMVVDKAGSQVNPDDAVTLKEIMPYVSRGGLKLEHALREFNIDVRDRVAMDAGASTGGFTDCLLQHGVKKICAIDVGHGQLDWKLRNDPRVVLLEKTNVRYLEEIIGKGGSQTRPYGDAHTSREQTIDLDDLINRNIDIAVIDVSFISLLKVIPVVVKFLKEEGEIIALIKPQFEVGRKDVGKGVVKDEDRRLEVVEMIKRQAPEMGLHVIGVVPSPIKGPKGNVEYLIYMKREKSPDVQEQNEYHSL